jgi:hypothetical protein
LGVPEHLISYLRDYYAGGSTRLKVNGQISDQIQVNKGIKQGDPLSVHLFNCVIDLCTSKLNKEVGYTLAPGQKLNFLAFADDIVLLADSRLELEFHLKEIVKELGFCGLNINVKKCASLGIKAYQKKWVCDPASFLSIDDKPVPALNINSLYKYLGIPIGAKGTYFTLYDKLKTQIDNVKRAPLKPQQRLYILKNNIIPGLLHQLVLADVNKTTLKKLDIVIRKFINFSLKLPNGLSMGTFYTPVRDGGLGVQRLEVAIPNMKKSRLLNLLSFEHPLSPVFTDDSSFLASVNKATSSFVFKGVPLSSKEEAARAHRDDLLESVDGAGLRFHPPFSFGCLLNNLSFSPLRGRAFLDCVFVFFSSLPTPVRKHRANIDVNPMCETCINRPASLGHIMQECSRSFGQRVRRHNFLCNKLGTYLSTKHFNVIFEPVIKTLRSFCKPDILAIKNNIAYVIDTAIFHCNDNPDIMHENKVEKYRSLLNTTSIKETYDVREIEYGSLVFNWRGGLSNKSREFLVSVLGVSPSFLNDCIVSVLLGGANIWHQYNTSSFVIHRNFDIPGD